MAVWTQTVGPVGLEPTTNGLKAFPEGSDEQEEDSENGP